MQAAHPPLGALTLRHQNGFESTKRRITFSVMRETLFA
jgi:hypothetical protein